MTHFEVVSVLQELLNKNTFKIIHSWKCHYKFKSDYLL